MGRSNRRPRPSRPPALAGIQSAERDADGEDWQVRTIPAGCATKTYRCPGCDQSIPPGTGHLVTWQPGDCDGRRHWHNPCWRARDRRRPNRPRS